MVGVYRATVISRPRSYAAAEFWSVHSGRVPFQVVDPYQALSHSGLLTHSSFYPYLVSGRYRGPCLAQVHLAIFQLEDDLVAAGERVLALNCTVKGGSLHRATIARNSVWLPPSGCRAPKLECHWV